MLEAGLFVAGLLGVPDAPPWELLLLPLSLPEGELCFRANPTPNPTPSPTIHSNKTNTIKANLFHPPLFANHFLSLTPFSFLTSTKFSPFGPNTSSKRLYGGGWSYVCIGGAPAAHILVEGRFSALSGMSGGALGSRNEASSSEMAGRELAEAGSRRCILPLPLPVERIVKMKAMFPDEEKEDHPDYRARSSIRRFTSASRRLVRLERNGLQACESSGK